MVNMNRVNWKLILVVLISFIIFGVTAIVLRKLNRSNKAQVGLEKGTQAFEEGRWDQAAEFLGHYITKAPDNIEKIPILMNYAESQMNRIPISKGDRSYAIEAYRNVIQIERENKSITENTKLAQEKLIQIYLLKHSPEEAKFRAETALANNPTKEIKKLYALCLIKTRNYKEAGKAYESFIQDYPNDIQAYDAISKLAQFRPDEFTTSPLTWLDKAIKNNPEDAFAYIIRADYYTSVGEFKKAREDLVKSKDLNTSKELESYLKLASIYTQLQNPDMIKTYLSKAQTIDPQSHNLWRYWALYATSYLEDEKKVEIADQGLEIFKNYPWQFLPYAVELYINAKQLDKARDGIQKIKKRNYAAHLVENYEGKIAELNGEYTQAIRHWRSAMQLGYKNTDIQLNIARISSRLGNTYDAIQQLRNLISENPSEFRGYIELANLMITTQQWREAVKHARTARQIAPNDLNAEFLYLKARMNFLLEEKTPSNSNFFDDIDKRLVALQAKAAESPKIYTTLIDLAIHRSNFSKAENIIDQLKSIAPNSPKTTMAEIHLLLAKKESEQAKSKLMKAIERFPTTIAFDIKLADVLQDEKDHTACESILKSAIERTKNADDIKKLSLMLIRCYQKWNESSKAYALLTSLKDQYPLDIKIKAMLLKTDPIRNDEVKAKELVEELKNIEGDSGSRWRYEEALLLFNKNNFQKHSDNITSLLKESLAINTYDIASRLLLIETYKKTNKLSLAIMECEEALSQFPDDTDLIYQAIHLYYLTGNSSKGDKLLDVSQQKELNHPGFDYLHLQRKLRAGEHQSAETLLKDLIKKEPKNLELKTTLAKLYLDLNNTSQAKEMLKTLIQKEPFNIQISNMMIDCFLRENNRSQALEICQKLITHYQSSLSYRIRANTYAALDQMELAIQDIEQSTKLSPNDTNAWIEKSNFYNKINRNEESVSSILKAVELAPEDLNIRKYCVDLLINSRNQKHTQLAESILEKVLEKAPSDFEAQLLKARLLLTSNSLESHNQAINLLQQITRKRSDLTQAWLLLGNQYLKNKQSGNALNAAVQGLINANNNVPLLILKAKAEAILSPKISISTLNSIQDINEKDINIFLMIIDLHIADNNIQQAMELLNEEINEVENNQNLAILEIKRIQVLHKFDKEEAYKQIDRVKNQYANNPQLLTVHLKLLAHDNKWDNVLLISEQWLSKHPKFIKPLLQFVSGLTSQNSNESQEIAQKLLEKLLTYSPDNTAIMGQLAYLHQKNNRPSEAIKWLESSLKIQPNHVVSLNNLAWILSESFNENQKALTLATKGLELNEFYADLYDTRGTIYYKLGQYQKAADDYEKCLKLHYMSQNNIAGVHLHYGRTLVALEQYQKAQAILRQALTLHERNNTFTKADVELINTLLEQIQ